MSDQHDGASRGARAFLKEGIPARAGECPALAPRGDYELSCAHDGIDLCSCATRNRFTLSFDAYIQHLTEGRIALRDQ